MLPTSAETPRNIGKYVVERRLGQGGMADVFLCRQMGMGGFDRLVVVKQIRSDLRQRDDIIHMFLDEARIAAQISHPNVVQIFESGEARGLPYLVMEYVRGLSLEALVQALAERNAQPPPDLLCALAMQACAGLHAAHELRDRDGGLLGVVHRDISPQNLLVSSDGVLKIIDFGIARAKGRLARTHVGRLKGRVMYLAPEVISGGAVDRRADLYALGVVLYEILSGRPLFERSSEMGTISAVLTAPVVPLGEARPELDPELCQIVDRLIAREPVTRPDTAAALGTALLSVVVRAGQFVTPPQVAAYLKAALPDEIAALPEQTVPTTAAVRLPPELLGEETDQISMSMDGAARTPRSSVPVDQELTLPPRSARSAQSPTGRSALSGRSSRSSQPGRSAQSPGRPSQSSGRRGRARPPRSSESSGRPTARVPSKPTMQTGRADQPTEVVTAVHELTEVVSHRTARRGVMLVLVAVAVALFLLALSQR